MASDFCVSTPGKIIKRLICFPVGCSHIFPVVTLSQTNRMAACDLFACLDLSHHRYLS